MFRQNVVRSHFPFLAVLNMLMGKQMILTIFVIAIALGDRKSVV